MILKEFGELSFAKYLAFVAHRMPQAEQILYFYGELIFQDMMNKFID